MSDPSPPRVFIMLVYIVTYRVCLSLRSPLYVCCREPHTTRPYPSASGPLATDRRRGVRFLTASRVHYVSIHCHLPCGDEGGVRPLQGIRCRSELRSRDPLHSTYARRPSTPPTPNVITRHKRVSLAGNVDTPIVATWIVPRARTRRVNTCTDSRDTCV